MESVQPIIELKNLQKNYGEKPILKGIDLQIFPGQIIGYIGPNGAGKSTTVKILIGLIEDFEGEVTIDGLDIKKDALAVKSRIGYVPENAELYEVLTPKEYLNFVGKLYEMTEDDIERKTVKLLEEFGLGDKIDNRMDSFSKGMKQKVLIISALMHNPKILILDEPLSGLDANAVIIVKELISLLAKQGKTIFYCSHIMDVVEKVSDRIVVLSGGQILADGPIESLRENQPGSLEQIFSKLTGQENSIIQAQHIADSIID